MTSSVIWALAEVVILCPAIFTSVTEFSTLFNINGRVLTIFTEGSTKNVWQGDSHTPGSHFCVVSIYRIAKKTQCFFLELWGLFLKAQLCKLYNNKYMIAWKQIINTAIFTFIAALVLKLLSRMQGERGVCRALSKISVGAFPRN